MMDHMPRLVLIVLAIAALVHAQDQSGFISIDCGTPNGFTYTDEETGIAYTSDLNFTETGSIRDISSVFNIESLEQQFLNVRSFPEGTRNCYTLKPRQGKDNRYLIRARFMYGNYDGEDRIPGFNLFLGVNYWTTVRFENSSSIVTKEIIHVPSSDYIYVCLVNTGLGVPFISALELRVLKNTTYASQSGSLELHDRFNFGSTTSRTVRFKDDAYDRVWKPYNTSGQEQLNTTLTIDAHVHNDYQMPSIVMETAMAPNDDNAPLTFSWKVEDPATEFYIYMHFSELEQLKPNQLREFNIYLNGELWYGPLAPTYLSTSTVYSVSGETGGEFNVSINGTENSTLAPLINACEVYAVKQLLQSQTNQEDVDAIMNIKSAYGIKRNWQGDPCSPTDYMWIGLNCNYNGIPKIVSLNLSSSGLTSAISPYVANLRWLEFLDLSNNSLTGSVPESLSQLQFLSLVNLRGNKLSGSVPDGLVQRSHNGSLLLSTGENEDLCLTPPCKKKRKFIIPLVASIGALCILVIAMAIALIFSRKKRVRNASEESNNGVRESKKHKFTYSEVLSITNNFERVVGKGGFGTVYHGCLNDSQVAVKMLSSSAVQGYINFQIEAELLVGVGHDNLTCLLGYWCEGTSMGLIYHYMDNGNLEAHLLGANATVLSWEERLQIALDAAQGLEYLHNTCKPPIIHRDVKSTNILLSENLRAKLVDFGLSRVFHVEGGSQFESNVEVGTPGYLDPEYHISRKLDEKSDVYSFGVVLLELITSQPAIASNHEKTHVIQRVSFMLANGDTERIVDPRLQGGCDTNSIMKLVKIALSCVSKSPTRRPTMSEVVLGLKQCLETERSCLIEPTREVLD